MNTQTLAANKYLKLRAGGRTILVREIRPGLGQRVEMRRLRGFQFRESARLLRQAAKTIGHQQDDFRVVLNVQIASEAMNVHKQAVGFRLSAIGEKLPRRCELFLKHDFDH